MAEARVANIIEYNKKAEKKLEPIVVVIDEFADLADQLETKKDRDAFFKPVQRIAQAGRSRGIHPCNLHSAARGKTRSSDYKGAT